MYKIKLYKDFTEIKNKYYLTPNELYLYCVISSQQSSLGNTLTSIDLMHHTNKIKFHSSRDSINKGLIKNTLNELYKKNIIDLTVLNNAIEQESFDLEYKNINSLGLDIILKEVTDDIGQYNINLDRFFEFETIVQFYIYCAIKGWDYSDEVGGRQISEMDFSRLLSISDTTLRKNINELIEQKKLFKLTKRVSSENFEKDSNRYRTIPFPDEYITLPTKKKQNRSTESEYENWRITVLDNDNQTCKICGASAIDNPNVLLHAHHKDGYDWCIVRRTDLSNGVTLCDSCHTEFHVMYGYGGNTEQQYIEFCENKMLTT